MVEGFLLGHARENVDGGVVEGVLAIAGGGIVSSIQGVELVDRVGVLAAIVGGGAGTVGGRVVGLAQVAVEVPRFNASFLFISLTVGPRSRRIGIRLVVGHDERVVEERKGL